MDIRYEITPADLAVYRSESSKQGASYVAQVLIFGAVYLLFVLSDILLSTLLTTTPTTSLGINLLVRSTVGIGLLTLTSVVLLSISKWHSKKLRAVTGPNGLFCEHAFSIDESGFTETTPVNRSSYNWAGVEAVDITDSFVIVKVRLCCSYFIPKRAFANNEELRTFVTTIRNYLSPGSGDVTRSAAKIDY